MKDSYFYRELCNIVKVPNEYRDTSSAALSFYSPAFLVGSVFLLFVFLLMNSIMNDYEKSFLLNFIGFFFFLSMFLYSIQYLISNKKRSKFCMCLYSGHLSYLFEDLNHKAIVSRKDIILFQYKNYNGIYGRLLLDIIIDINDEKTLNNNDSRLREINKIKASY
jgi:hypothetical protein